MVRYVSRVGILCLMAAPMAVPTKGSADDLSDKFRLLDERAASYQSFAQEQLPNSIKRATGIPVVRYNGSYQGPYLTLALKKAEEYGLPGDLFARLIDRESRWNPNAVSHKGAVGLGQLMPDTARGLGVDPRDPTQNLDGAARYLRRQYDSFKDWRLALAAYNAGPEAVRRYGGVPPFAETKAYVVAILGE